MSENLIEIESVSKKFCRNFKRSLYYGFKDIVSELLGRNTRAQVLRKDEFWVLKDINLKIKRGQCVGILGPNGAGKSTLLRMINGAYKPETGQITIRGRMCSMIELGMGFDFSLTGYENIFVYGTLLGMSETEIRAKIDDIISFSELGEFINMPVQKYSNGMKVRLGFAVAAQVQPDVLLLDEVLAVGDAGFKAKCLDTLGTKFKSAAVVLVTHNVHQVSRYCDSCIVLNKGQATHYENPQDAIKIYNELTRTSSKQKETRFESGDIKLLDIIVKSCSKVDKKNVFSYGETVDVSLDLLSQTIDGEVEIHAHIVNANGLPLASIQNEKQLFTVEKGMRKRLLFSGLNLNLSMGDYAVQVVVSSRDGKLLYIWYKNICPFRVEGDRYHSVNFIFRGGFHESAF